MGCPLLPFFMAFGRLFALMSSRRKASRCRQAFAISLSQEAQTYFDLSMQLLAPFPARLIVIGGLSGTGKSTLAAAIAEHFGPPPGARVLSSDRIRKQLWGVPAETRLEQEAYTQKFRSASTPIYSRRRGRY